jgi:hypothetical protein
MIRWSEGGHMKKIIAFFLSLLPSRAVTVCHHNGGFDRQPDGSKFCHFCGAHFDVSSQKNEEPQAEEPVLPRDIILGSIQARRDAAPGEWHGFIYWGPDPGMDLYIATAVGLVEEGLITLEELLKLTLFVGFAEGQGSDSLGCYAEVLRAERKRIERELAAGAWLGVCPEGCGGVVEVPVVLEDTETLVKAAAHCRYCGEKAAEFTVEKKFPIKFT